MKNIFNFKKFTESKDSTIGPSGLIVIEKGDLQDFEDDENDDDWWRK